MKITETKIKIGDLIKGYRNLGEEGVFGYNGKLNIRPPYQREFIYNVKQQQLVIDTVLQGFPLSTIYWNKVDNNKYEVLDGQQRTMSICSFINDGFGFKVDGKNEFYWRNLNDQAIKDKIFDYELSIYICEGSEIDRLKWFDRINIAGEKLTAQELRNAAYVGNWLLDAKNKFSKTNCIAYQIAKDYLKGATIRQEYLEKVLEWIIDAENYRSIEQYMARHQHDLDADELWTYFRQVINWVKLCFPTYYKEMKGIEWGLLYNKYSSITKTLDKEVKKLMEDEDVQKKSGIFQYLLSGNEKYLSIRCFDKTTVRTVFERQNGICPVCKKTCLLEEMEADHITPWSKGGKTILDNCQMLCKECNRRKADV